MPQNTRESKATHPLKVLLVRPPAPNILSFTKILDNEPLELEYLATALAAKGHMAFYFDGLIDPNGFERTFKEVQPHVVAITGYITQELLMLDYCKSVKNLAPSTYTILGGVHVQLNYARFYSEPVDFMCRSEDVWAFADLIDYLANPLSEDPTLTSHLTAINGLVYRDKDREFVVNPLLAPNINDLPIPNRSFFYANKEHYRYLDLTPVATLKTAFSCPHSCNFCYCTQLAGGRYQTRDLHLVMEEIETITVEAIQIVDDDFLVDSKRVGEFLDALEERQIQKTFVCYSRADHIVKNPELVARMSRLGFRYFLVGLEAIDSLTLSSYNKKTTADVNRQCAEILAPLAPKTYLIGLMIVSHEAKPADFTRLYDWVVAQKLHHVTISVFTPIPGTPLYDDYSDRITSTDIRDWDFLHLVLEPTHMSRSAFYRAYYTLIIKLYRIARKTGMYSFMDLPYYRKMLGEFLKRQF